MDTFTSWIAQMNNPAMTAVASALDNEAILVLITLVLVVAFEKRKEKIAKVAFAVLIAVLLAYSLKYALKTERPCEVLQSKVPCPWSYAFPSGHTIMAFTVALAFLNKKSFPFFLAYAVFVAFTRLYLGVHSFEDVAGSVALAPFAYYVADEIWKKTLGKKYAFRDEPGH